MGFFLNIWFSSTDQHGAIYYHQYHWQSYRNSGRCALCWGEELLSVDQEHKYLIILTHGIKYCDIFDTLTLTSTYLFFFSFSLEDQKSFFMTCIIQIFFFTLNAHFSLLLLYLRVDVFIRNHKLTETSCCQSFKPSDISSSTVSGNDKDELQIPDSELQRIQKLGNKNTKSYCF